MMLGDGLPTHRGASTEPQTPAPTHNATTLHLHAVKRVRARLSFPPFLEPPALAHCEPPTAAPSSSPLARRRRGVALTAAASQLAAMHVAGSRRPRLPAGGLSPPRTSSSSCHPDLKEQNGLEVPRALQWVRWQAGAEFAKVLVVKNVSTEVICFTCKLLPHGSPFSVEFPEPRRLSPGMSATIKVLFRPPARQQFCEQLELLSGATSIFVALSAVLPASKLQLPPGGLDFGCVPVHQPCLQQLPITNVGDAPLSFAWRVQQPFAVAPATGQLAPGQTLVCEVCFHPQEAAAFRVAAACSLDNGELLTVQVSGMSKFPFLSLERECVDCGSVVVGHTAEAFVRFGNHSPVPAAFAVARAAGCQDGTLSVQPQRGTLQPNEYSLLRVTFAPRATGTFSCQSFTLACAGGNSLALTCQGTAVGPALRLSGRVFAFGSVRSGQAAPPKTLYLDNASDVPLHYQFLAEPGGVFELSRAAGVIPPRLMAHAAIRLAAGARPGNYWQRIVCLVKDAEPQAIDVLASCFDDSSRPPPLSYKHIRAQLLGRAAVTSESDGGSSSLAASGEQQQQQLFKGLRGSTSSSMGSRGLQQSGQYGSSSGEGAGAPLIGQQHQQQQLAGPDSWRLLFEGLGVTGLPVVSVSERFLEFGCCSKLSPSAPRSFQVTNNTAAKLTVSMLVPTWADPVAPTGAVAQQQQQVFTAFPELLELRPQASGTFRVAFRPPRDGQYYTQTLVVQASAKAMRSFRLVQDDAVVPPWSMGILASGRTFAAVNPELAPKVSLSTSSISFPPCRLGEAVHQTLCLTNSGDTPAHFAFADAARGGSAAAAGGSSSSGGHRPAAGSSFGPGVWFGAQFAVLPAQGVLEPHSQCLVALRFQPASLAPAELQLACLFNHSPSSSAALLLSGAASEPQLALDLSSSRLFFRPACVGAASQRQLTVRNVSRVPVGWQWVLSRKLQDAVTVEPMAGVLRGFEAARVTVTFAPSKSGVYDARAALLMLPPDAVSDATASAAGLQDSSLNSAAAAASASAAAAAYGEAAAVEAAAGLEDGQEQQLDAGAAGSAGSSAVDKLILTIVGKATQGALAITPASIAFGSISVGHPRTQALALVNQSSGVLRYRLCIVDERPQDGADAADAACEFSSPVSVLGAARLAASSDGSDSSSTCQADCWVDAPEGTINPRASKTRQLTILPRRRGAYRLQLNLHAAAVPHSAPAAGSLRGSPVQQHPCSGALAGSPTAGSPRKQGSLVVRHSKSASGTHLRPLSSGPEAGAAGVDADRGFSKQGSAGAAGTVEAIRAVRSAGSAGGSPVAPAAALAPTWRADAPPLATAAVTADASFPSLLLTDVFCEGMPKQVAWQLLGATQLNEELRAAVNVEEVQAQVLADRGALSNDNAAVLLPPFQLDLGAATAGGSARSFWVTFANAGVLPLQWELHSYDAPQVDLENWVEAAKPQTQAERERAFILDHKVFEVLPHAGTLQQGQVQQVCLRFNPVAEGAYCLPLFLRVKDGKQLQLQLSGRAVAPAAQLALAVRGSHSCLLAPAPIGELQPPLQQFTLRNGGPAPLAYSLDTSPLQQLASQNYAAEVFKYAGGSPLSGEVPVGGAAVFNWLFQPLEAKGYSVALPLTLGGGATPQPLLLHGRGYHPTSQPEAAAPNAAEAAQHWQGWLGFSAHPTAHAAPAAAWDGGSAASGRCLLSSPEVLDLGVVLPAGTCRQLLTLSNAAAAPVAFAWQLGVFEAARGIISGRLAITPASGVLQPGEARLCQVSFEAGLAAQLFSGEVYCQAVPAPPDDDSSGSGQGGVGAHGLTLQQWQQLRDGGGQPDDVDEEVFAQHPPRQVLPVFGRKLRQRLPLHLSMTEAVCNRFDTLRQQFQQAALTLQRNGRGAPQSLQQQQGTASGHGSCEQQAVAPQLLAVTLQGAVLSKVHINAGSYLRGPMELQRARRLLPVAHLLPAVQDPVNLLPAPGSLGPSAAAAAAAAAAADAAGPDCDLETLAHAVGAVEELLTDVWAEEDVVAAFDSLAAAPVPTLEQLLLEQQQQGVEAESPVAVGSTPVAAVLAQPAFAAVAESVLNEAVLGLLQEEACACRGGGEA